ncbi:DNA-directed RNA polymerase subunit delta [Sediminibacillus albus]|uniref:Probable DNA-directed RNA polymerase subunit delta n=1 Tax=Sediminibacillus albus TaxID=407036 RepID=A0A1G8ZKU1_9BACI|nr:DNA-directed RNA polymerase subunit delta [Sediminibacillus albus]SDK15686.1 DNA-directed RNA polymerase subunit delta [Sediminibacillus albus]
MSLKNYSHEEIADFSMIEIANLILLDEKKAMDFREVYDRIAEYKGYSKAQKDEYIAQFYTDLNTDGRFLTGGSNLWGLKVWYPVEQIEEEITDAPKKKKKKKKAKAKAKAKTSKRKKDDIYVEEEIEDDLSELEEEDLDFDDLDTTDFIDDTDDDFDDDDDTDADKDDDYDGDFRSGKLGDEDKKVVEEDVSYVGDEDDDKANDDNYN